MLAYFTILAYPTEMPEGGECGTNKEHYDKRYSGKYVQLDSASGGYPAPTSHIQQAQWWTSQSDMERYRKMFPYLNPMRVRVEVG